MPIEYTLRRHQLMQMQTVALMPTHMPSQMQDFLSNNSEAAEYFEGMTATLSLVLCHLEVMRCAGAGETVYRMCQRILGELLAADREAPELGRVNREADDE